MKSRIRLVRLFFFSSAALLLILILVLSAFWGMSEYRDLQNENRRITAERLKSGSALIRRQVDRTFSFLEYKHASAKQRLENDLKERVLAASATAARLYEIYGKRMSGPELSSLIIESLRPMRFHRGRSRFFVLDFTGRYLLADQYLGGENPGGLTDADHHLIAQDMIRIARDRHEGFYIYDGNGAATGKAAADHHRIVFVKYFAPLNCIIGAGEDQNTIEYELQQEALAHLRQLRYDDSGYIFVLRPDGVLLSHPDKDLIGKNLLHNPDERIRNAVARLIEAGKRPEGGDTRYLWPKPSGGHPVPKLSYTRTFKPWGRIVGTGIYLDDIDRDIAAATAGYQKALYDEFVSGAFLFAGFILFSLILYRFIAARMDTELGRLTAFFHRAAASHEKIDPRKLKFSEFATIGASANRLVDDFLETQNQLQYRIDFENLIMAISTRIINSTPARLDREIDRALAGIGQMTGMARSYLFQFRDNDSRMDNTHEWCTEGVDPHRYRLRGLAVADFPTVRNTILEGRNALVPDVADLPPESAVEKREFEDEGIRSLILVPTMVAEKVTGFLGLDATRPTPVWSDEIVALLNIAGEIIAGGLERRRADANIKEIEQIVESTPAVVFRWQNETGWPVDVVTDNVEKVFGYTAADFLSKRILYDAVIHPEDRPWVNREVAAYSRQARDEFSQEYRIVAADGSTRWIEDRTYIRRNAGGQITHYQGVVLDISELKQLETAHRDLERQYEQAQKMEAIGRFSGGVAHDFNNLLTVILGYTEILLQKTDMAPPHLDGLKEIRDAALKARDLTQHLLVFSRKQPMQLEVVELNEIVAVSSKMLGRLIGEDVDLQLRTAPEKLCVMADITQIDQILMNLAVNARDAMPGGGALTIETARVELDGSYAERKANVAPGSYAMIGVSDTGSGMEEATRARIFEPFFTTKGMEKGTGLGLATCYSIVKQHGGHIFCYSEPGRGTTFKIYLPLVPDEPEDKEEPVREETPAPASATVLVIEDDPSVLSLTSRILSDAGYRVLEAEIPEDAAILAESTEQAIDLVVTDVIMPQMKGPEIYAEIRKRHPGAGVLYMSGYTPMAFAAQDILLPESRFIGKPFSAQRFLERVVAVLSEAGRMPGDPEPPGKPG